MSSEEDHGVVQGMGEDDLNNYIGEEGEEDEEDVSGYLAVVEKQNDALMEGNFKQFLSLCKSEQAGVKVDHKLAKDMFQKESYKSSSFPADVASIVRADTPELLTLVAALKNSIMGMRVKLAAIVDAIGESEADPQKSISLINLRIEVLADYWSYLSLLVLKKVNPL